MSLADNKLSFIEDGCFCHLDKLEKINFNNNKLTEWGASPFSGLVSLRELYLCENALNEIDENAFDTCLETLRTIEVDENKILKKFKFKLLKK